VGLQGRTVLVTGAGGGLGASIAVGLGLEGAAVALTDLPGLKLSDAESQCRDAGVRATAFPADLQTAQSESLIASVADQLGPVDGLVHAAGVMQTKPFSDISVEEWRRVIDINLTSAFPLLQAMARQEIPGGGSAVLVSSVAGRSGRPNAPHYAASKAGLLSLTKSAALALGPEIRVNAVCPGVFMTPMWEQIIRDRDDEFGPGAGAAYLEDVLRAAPLNRPGDAQELTSVVAFLLSDAASYITGQALNVDGGLEMD